MGERKLEDQSIAFDDILSFIKGVGLFKKMVGNDGALEKIASYLKVREYAAGEDIMTMGSSDMCMYLLYRGTAEVIKQTISGDRFHITYLCSDNKPYMGEGALLHDSERSSGIIAKTDCTCLYMHKNEFEEFYELYPAEAAPIILAIAKGLSNRLRKQSDDFFLMYNALVNEIRGS